GVVHRDLKPSNVFIDARGEPRVLDFGVARPLGEGSRATKTGQLVGTLAYMSPEQASGRFEVTPCADVYSLGVILYELLTGRLPIATDHVPLHEAVRRVREEEPIPAGAVRKELRGDLETILGKALAKETNRRYASAAELAEDLRLFLEHRPIRARRPTSLYVAWKLVRRHRLLAASAGLLFVVVSLAQYAFVQNLRKENEKVLLAITGSFWRELAQREKVRSDIVSLQVQAQRWIDLQTFSIPLVEEWKGKVELHVARLAEYRAFLAAAPAWIRKVEEGGAIGADDREYALYVLEDTVDTLESILGPRGQLPLLSQRLEELRQEAGGNPR
ncbi:MAG: serine/threonine-protein kinase, partial [Planctomycetota bacterium]